jgi:MFS family permease
MGDQRATPNDADRNWRRFVLFRVFFNSRFYYPVLAILFLDLGLSATEYTLLNFAWAIAIVLTDVPAGVLADRIGRKPLVVAAAVFMVLEMILLGIAPRHGGVILLLCCLVNRIFSGMAEGMASGADEALVFDSLAERGRSDEWPLVLDQVMRWQGVGMIVAMLVGGAVYDPGFMNRLGAAFHLSLHLDQSTSLRFPIYLNTVTALFTLFLALGLREPKVRMMHAAPVDAERTGPQGGAWPMAVRAAKWIVGTPIALFVIVAGVLLDSVSRLFLTFGSSYFRLIELPEASFGVIGALLGGIGLFVSPLARRMVKSGSIAENFAWVLALVFFSLIGVACRWNYVGVIFAFPLGAGMMILGYMVSYYLNALVDSHHRATVLSFKGLVFNLGYGFISLLFALALRAVRDHRSTEVALGLGLRTLPVWLLVAAVACFVCFRKHGRPLGQRI